MSWQGFLARLVQKLEQAGIPYMVSGAISSSLHGEPRATNDIDIVIDPAAGQLTAFVQSLGADYYVSPEAARDAFRDRSMFNVIDLDTGWKADFFLRKERPFSIEEFRRRRPGTPGGVPAFTVSPEDAILSKLEWDRITSSERQVRDAVGIAVVQWESLDQAYLHRWARELGVERRLTEMLREAAALKGTPLSDPPAP
jgi:hypothetical protein